MHSDSLRPRPYCPQQDWLTAYCICPSIFAYTICVMYLICASMTSTFKLPVHPFIPLHIHHLYDYQCNQLSVHYICWSVYLSLPIGASILSTIQLLIHPFIPLYIYHLHDYVSATSYAPSYLSAYLCVYRLPIYVHYMYRLANYPCILLVTHLCSYFF